VQLQLLPLWADGRAGA